MTAVGTRHARAFALRFKDLRRWSVNSFSATAWEWPEAYIAPLSTALSRRQEVLDRSKNPYSTLQMMTVRFDGSIEPRSPRGTSEVKGTLYSARPGEVIYSKIDVRNGAIGVVPPHMTRAAVTSEFPVYRVDEGVAEPQFITILFRTSAFRRMINSMISGGSGRKRVLPEQLEAVSVPLPPIPIQRAVVMHSQGASGEIDARRKDVLKWEQMLTAEVLGALGLPVRDHLEVPRVFGIRWKDLDRWSVGYASRSASGFGSLNKNYYPLQALGQIAKIAYGLQKSPQNRPGLHARPYLRVANVQRGSLDLTEVKYINVPDVEYETFRLQNQDLLVCEGNSADLVGRPAIWKGEIPGCVHQNHILRVRVDSEMALPEYVLEYMQTPPARAYFRSRAKFTTNLASINSRDLREFLLPLPPLGVQRGIVDRVQQMRNKIAQDTAWIEQRVATVTDEIERMILGSLPPPI